VGNVSILDSHINATSTWDAAGIGSGPTDGLGLSRVGTLSIIGGNINATGLNGAGIGSGGGNPGCISSVGDLSIIGGNINATGSDGFGPGIGSGLGKNEGISSVGNLSILDSNISAAPASGAPGIGSGQGELLGASRVGTLSIIGGTINARGSDGAGIGSGWGTAGGISSVGSLSIIGGNINATGSDGAGIGSGEADDEGISMVGNASILDSNIIATSAYGGAGSGSGDGGGDGISSVGDLSIIGGNISADGSYLGAGVGSGSGKSSVSRINLFNGSFHLRSSHSGVGFGPSTSVNEVRIWNGYFDCSEVRSGFCFNANSITFGGDSMIVITGFHRVVPGSPATVHLPPELYFEYSKVSSRESVVGVPLLHLESILLPQPAVYDITIREIGGLVSGIERTVSFNSRRSRGCAISVPSIGNYSIFFESILMNASGYLHHNQDFSFAAYSLSDNLYYDVDYRIAPPAAWSLPPEESVPWKPVRIVLFVVAGLIAMLLIASSSMTLCQLMKEFEDQANVNIDIDFEID
jgi:hypothetical protein